MLTIYKWKGQLIHFAYVHNIFLPPWSNLLHLPSLYNMLRICLCMHGRGEGSVGWFRNGMRREAMEWRYQLDLHVYYIAVVVPVLVLQRGFIWSWRRHSIATAFLFWHWNRWRRFPNLEAAAGGAIIRPVAWGHPKVAARPNWWWVHSLCVVTVLNPKCL